MRKFPKVQDGGKSNTGRIAIDGNNVISEISHCKNGKLLF